MQSGRGSIERLRDSARALSRQIDERKKALCADVSVAWTRLEKRHQAERVRDEQRIARRAR